MSGGHNLRREKLRSVLKVRAKVLNAAREWFNQKAFTEVHGPTIIPAVGEWSGYFEVKYFDEKAYLTQGLQPYADFFVEALGKIYTIAPTFRAEKLRSQRHLTEYWRIEAAVPECDLDCVLRVQEELMSYICHSLSEEAEEELKFLRGDVEGMAKVKLPFPRLTYDEVIEVLQKEGVEIWWGQELDWGLEKHLSLGFDQPFFVTEFPVSVETFFYKSHPKRSELVLAADMLAPEGYGEIAGGGQMITKKNVLLKKMAEEKIDTKDQRGYLDLRKFGVVPYSGFVVGVERLIRWICKLENISDASMFPRVFDNIYP